LEVNGVGFELAVPNSVSERVGRGADLLLWTHLLHKEDGPQLFGFLHRPERDLFRLLLKVNGVGPKLALQVISALDPDELIQVMAAEDWKRLTRIPGIGPKTARRLMIELKEKLTDRELQTVPAGGGAPVQPVLAEAYTALTNLGFTPEAIRVALKEFTPQDGEALGPGPTDLEDVIRKALVKLAP